MGKPKNKADQDKELPTLTFATATKWKRWLANNHDILDGVWLRILKKNSGQR